MADAATSGGGRVTLDDGGLDDGTSGIIDQHHSDLSVARLLGVGGRIEVRGIGGGPTERRRELPGDYHVEAPAPGELGLAGRPAQGLARRLESRPPPPRSSLASLRRPSSPPSVVPPVHHAGGHPHRSAVGLDPQLGSEMASTIPDAGPPPRPATSHLSDQRLVGPSGRRREGAVWVSPGPGVLGHCVGSGGDDGATVPCGPRSWM